MTTKTRSIWSITIEQAKDQLDEIKKDLDDPRLVGIMAIGIRGNLSDMDACVYVVNPRNDPRLNEVNLLGVLELAKAMVLNGDFSLE